MIGLYPDDKAGLMISIVYGSEYILPSPGSKQTIQSAIFTQSLRNARETKYLLYIPMVGCLHDIGALGRIFAHHTMKTTPRCIPNHGGRII